jgi:hypothetical protein
MALIGLSEAAKLTGRNQTTIHRAMKTGRLSFSLGESGERRIDTAELDRVFGINRPNGEAMAPPMQSHVTPVHEIELLRAWLADREETIRDLRQRFDMAAEERRQERQQEAEERRRLLALLTGPRVPWWRRWFR